MYKRITLIATLASFALIAAGASSPATARYVGGAELLLTCISNYNACYNYCLDAEPFPPPNTCTEGCDDNHAACVDLAFSNQLVQVRPLARGPLSEPWPATDMPRANRLPVAIMAMVAEEERRMISERTKVALAAAKRRCVKLGGYRANAGLTQRSHLRPIVLRI
jgi:Resolvase, N terminal domain